MHTRLLPLQVHLSQKQATVCMLGKDCFSAISSPFSLSSHSEDTVLSLNGKPCKLAVEDGTPQHSGALVFPRSVFSLAHFFCLVTYKTPVGTSGEII